MKNNNFHFLLIAACIFGMVTSSQGARGLKSPAGGAIPQIIHMRSIPDAQPAGTQSVREIPFNCQSDKSQIDQLKIGASADDAVSSAVLPDLSAPMKASGGGGGGTVAPLHIGTKFTGPVQNGYIPYDAAIAVGPNHIVAMSNAQFAIYSKSGTLISLKQNSQFFPTDAGANTNPKCYYDASGHFVLFASQAQNPLAYMNVAVSQTSDPTGAWWMYHLDWTIDGSTNTGFWGSWPTLGYDDSAIYIAANQYSFATIYNASVFAYAKVRVLNKPQLFNGATATWTDFTNLHNADGTPAFCVTPGCMLSSGGSEYLLNNSAGGGSTVTMWRIDNAVSKPTLTLVATVPVGTYSIPPNARQAGRGSPYIATGDCRLQSVVMRGGVLYTALTVYYGGGKVKPGAGIRYLAISTSGSVSKNILYYTSGIDFYYPAVTVDASGNMFMVFSRSGPSEYASMYMTGMMTS